MVKIMDALRQITTSIKEWVDENKVQKVSGKGLSTNDYTTAEKDKVKNMATGLIVLDDILYLKKDDGYISDAGVDLSQYGDQESDNELTNIDFSNFENGSFTEIVDGEIIIHTVIFDDVGRPVNIDGVVITWDDN